ncbi:MAG TPA: Maf family protein [Terriglobales bacterium]|jgi:septum formation protein
MLVLASASPRRQELLRNAEISFTVHPANIPEMLLPGESPKTYAERLAREKAEAVFRLDADKCVLGADTIVLVDDEVLGKPRDAADAARMLRLLSGRSHRVITGVCLLGLGFVDVRSETTTVEMQELHDDEIAAYVASGEPMDKAGAYAIQGWASRWISKIEGDYFNVVGLPVSLVYRMLGEHGALVFG